MVLGAVERLGFNMPVAASTLGHYRLLSGMLRRRFSLSYNEFTLLFVLRSVEGAAMLEELSSYLILARKTVLTLLAELEDRGLVTKRSLASDRRWMEVELSEAGRSCVDDILAYVDRCFQTVFCRNLPSDEFSGFMNASTMRASLDAIRGKEVRLRIVSEGQKYYSVEHFVYWRALVEAWTEIVHERCGLPYNAFGILALLNEKGQLDTSAVVDALMLARSEVSARKSQLVALGAVVETPHPHDARKTCLLLTDSGRNLVRTVQGALEDYMVGIDSTPNEETAAVINTWYYRMYTNIRTYRGSLDEL